MALMASDELRWLFLIVTGDEFPDVNEDLVRELAEVWEVAERGLGELGLTLRAAVARIRENFAGQAEQAFVAVMAPFVDGEQNYFDVAAGFFHQLTDMLRELARNVEYLKYVVILELSMLAAEVKWALTMTLIFGPIPLMWLAARSEMTRQAIKNVIAWVKRKLAWFILIAQQARTLYTEMHWLARGGLTGMTVSMGNQMLVTAGAQVIQFAKGTRTQWNLSYLQDSAVVGAIGGALAPFVGIATAHLTKRPASSARHELKDALDGIFNAQHHATDWHHEFAHALAHITAESVHEGLTATLATAALTHQFTLSWADFTAGASSGIARTTGKIFGHIINHLTLAFNAHKTHHSHEKHDTLDNTDLPAPTGNPYHNPTNNNTSFWGRLRGGGLDDDTSSHHDTDNHDTDNHDTDNHDTDNHDTSDNGSNSANSGNHSPHHDPHYNNSRHERLHEQVPAPAADHNRPATLGTSQPVAETENEAGATTTGTSTTTTNTSVRGTSAPARNPLTPGTTTTNTQPAPLNTENTSTGNTGPHPGTAPDGRTRDGQDLTLAHDTPKGTHSGIAPANGASAHTSSPSTLNAPSNATSSSPGPPGDTPPSRHQAPPLAGQPVTTTAAHPLPAQPGTPAGPTPAHTAPTTTPGHHTNLHTGPGQRHAGPPQDSPPPSTTDAPGNTPVVPGTAPFAPTTSDLTPSTSSPRHATPAAPQRGRSNTNTHHPQHTTALPGTLPTASPPPTVTGTQHSSGPAAEATASAGHTSTGHAPARATGTPPAHRPPEPAHPPDDNPTASPQEGGNAEVVGLEEALVFHWQHHPEYPVPVHFTSFGEGETGLNAVAREILANRREGYALVSVSSVDQGERSRILIVSGEPMTFVDARSGGPVSEAELKRVGAVEAYVVGGRPRPLVDEAAPTPGLFRRNLEEYRKEYEERASLYERRLAGYLRHLYPGWPAVINEFRFARFMLANESRRRVDQLTLGHLISELTASGQSQGGRLTATAVPREIEGEAQVVYRLLTWARQVNERPGAAPLDLGLLRLGLLSHLLTNNMASFHQVMRAAQLTDPHRDTGKADPGLAYADHFGRYRFLYPIAEEALRKALGPFPDDYAVTKLTPALETADEREPQLADRHMLLLERRRDTLIALGEMSFSPPDPRPGIRDSLYQELRLPKPSRYSERKRMETLEDYSINARENQFWTAEKARAAAREARYEAKHLIEAYYALSSSRDAWVLSQPDPTTVLKIAADLIRSGRRTDVGNLAATIATSLTQPQSEPARPRPGEPDAPAEQPDAPAERARKLVNHEIERLPIRGIPKHDPQNGENPREIITYTVTQAILNGAARDDYVDLAQSLVAEHYADPRWQERDGPEFELYGEPATIFSPTWLAKNWWYRTQDTPADDFKSDRGTPPIPNGPLHPDLMRGITGLNDALRFLAYYLYDTHKRAISRQIFREISLESLGSDIPVMTALDTLSGRNPPPGSYGILVVFPYKEDRLKEPVGYAMLVDALGIHLVDVRGERVTWPRQVPHEGHVIAFLQQPTTTRDNNIRGAPIAGSRKFEFAHHFHRAFTEGFHALHKTPENLEEEVVLPQAVTPRGRKGIGEIIRLLNDGGKGTAARIYIANPRGEETVLNVINNGNGKPEYLSKSIWLPNDDQFSVSAVVVGPDRKARFGHLVGMADPIAGPSEAPVKADALGSWKQSEASIPELAKFLSRLHLHTKPGGNAVTVISLNHKSRLESGTWHLQKSETGAITGTDASFSKFIQQHPERIESVATLELADMEQDQIPFFEWAGANWLATRSRKSADLGSFISSWLFSPLETIESKYKQGLKVVFEQDSNNGPVDRFHRAARAFMTHPGRPYIAARGWAEKAIIATAVEMSNRRDSDPNSILDQITEILITNPEPDQRHIQPMRGIARLGKSLQLYATHMKRFGAESDQARRLAPLAHLARRVPESFGEGGMTAVQKVIDRISATTGAAAVVFARRPEVPKYQLEMSYSSYFLTYIDNTVWVDDGQPEGEGMTPLDTVNWNVLRKHSIFALGTRPDGTFIAGIPRESVEPEAGGSSPDTPLGLRGGYISSSALDSTADDEPIFDDDADLPGLADAVAELSTWAGRPATPEMEDLGTAGGPTARALSQEPELAGNGFHGLARVRDSLPASGGAALLAVNVGEPTARMVAVLRSQQQIDLIDYVQGRRIRITPDNIYSVGKPLGDIHAALFDADQRPVPLIPLDGYQNAVYETAEREHKLRENLATGQEIGLPGTVGRVVSWFGKMYLITKNALLPELAADLAAAVDREIVALVVGADAEDPIRWMVFPPLGRPLPVKPEDLPPEAQAALADLDGPGDA